jgi:hypothetical protein
MTARGSLIADQAQHDPDNRESDEEDHQNATERTRAARNALRAVRTDENETQGHDEPDNQRDFIAWHNLSPF